MSGGDPASGRLAVALDLSPLVLDPLSPAALRVLETIGELSVAESDVRLLGVAPEGDLPALPPSIGVAIAGSRPAGPGAVRYTHFHLPRIAHRLGADVLLLAGSYPALRSPVPVALLDEAIGERPDGGWGRLAEAAGRAALSGAVSLYPRQHTLGLSAVAGEGVPIHPPAASSAEPQRWAGNDLVLAHGVSSAHVGLLLSAWTWVASASDARLMPLTARPRLQEQITEQARQLGLSGSVVAPPNLDPHSVPELYGRAKVLLLSGGLTGASPLRWAMGSRLPVAAVDEPALGASLGDAGYLVRPGDARRLGAACLTLLVDEQLAAELAERGWRRMQIQASTPQAESLQQALRRVSGSRPPGSRRPVLPRP